MSDNTANRGAADRSRVNLNQPHEVRYWTSKFGCTEDQLREAVGRVGVMAQDVEAYLSRANMAGATEPS